MKRKFSYHCLRPGWARCNQVITSILLAALLAGLIPPPAARLLLPDVATALVPSLPTVQAAPLAQAVSGSNVLTVTKTLVGTGSGPFNITVNGSNGYLNNTTVSPGTPTVLTGLASGVYTVTEASPGAGWTTTYTATASSGSASGGSSNAVVTLQNSGSLAAFSLNASGATTLPSSYPAVIMDNADAGFTTTGFWFSQTEAAYNGVDRQTDANNTGDQATWTFSGLTPGYYQVATTWVGGANRSTAASYSVIGVTTTNVSVNQQAGPGDFTASGFTWEYLTQNIQVGAGGVLTVRLSDGPTQSGRYVVADAVRIQRLREFTTNQITGMVYRDYNSDGQWTTNTTTQEDGVSGVTVTLYNSTSSLLATTTTGSDGTYAFNSVTTSGPFRVVFSNLPSGYEPTTHGTANGTSTQFITGAGQAGNVSLGIFVPTNYAQDNPKLVTTQYWNGTAVTGGANQGAAAFNYDGTSLTQIANVNELGAVWGVAYQRSTKQIYIGAVMRRHVGLLNQPGTIYKLDYATSTTNPPVSVLTTIASAGSDPRGAGDLATTLTGQSRDPQAMAAVGRLGLGGLAMSVDGSTLYAVNLNAKTLEQINPTTGAQGTALAIPNPGCPNNDARPWAVKATTTGVLVGSVCENASPLRAYVQRYSGGSWTTLDLDATSANSYYELSYNKEWVWLGSYLSSNCTSAEVAAASQWHAWNDAWQTVCASVTTVIYTQPILSAIEVDVDGSLILGFMDRRAMQGGIANLAPTGSSTTSYEVMSGGDIRRVCSTASGYAPEGAVGCAQNDTGNDPLPPEFAAWSGLADAGTEFYGGEQFEPGASNVAHYETVLGGLAFLPGSGQVTTMVFDPIDGVVISGGTRWLSNSTGQWQRVLNIYTTAGPTTGNTSSTFAKSAGLGDVELLVDPAPIEIGNRVWNDLDGDGIQDAGEPGLSGITVSRQGPTNTVTTVTDANGLYYFGNLQTNTAYTLTVTPPSGYSVTTANAAALSGAGVTSNHAISDSIDSDATLVSGQATIYYTTGSAGQNNHGLDFGFTQPVYGQVDITNTAPAIVDLALVKTASVTTATLGVAFNYILTVTNQSSTVTATGVTLTDPLPVGLTYNSATPSGGTGGACTYNSGTRTVTCTWATLPPGQQAVAIIQVTP